MDVKTMLCIMNNSTNTISCFDVDVTLLIERYGRHMDVLKQRCVL